MRLNFHGAAQTVTGSQHLLEVNGSKLLLDCGLYQGHRDESYTRNRSFSYDPHSLDAVILSHAHIDHSGNLPNLVKQGFTGPIYTTRATADLADIMLRDSGHIQEKLSSDPALPQWWNQIDQWRAKNSLSFKNSTKVIKPQYAIDRLYALTRGHETYITTEVF